MNAITDTATLRAHFGAPSERAVLKQLDHLDPHCQAFIALSPFAVLATTDGAGNVDASPRGDAPGFVHVLDAHTLIILLPLLIDSGLTATCTTSANNCIDIASIHTALVLKR